MCVWDPRVKEAVSVFEPLSGSTPDCWAVTFGNSQGEDRCVCAG